MVYIGMEKISDLQIGEAGEHLVCADLILNGCPAFQSAQGLPYDLCVNFKNRIYRVQVKTTRSPRPVPQRVNHTEAYLFHTRRCGKGGRRSYDKGDFDILALVALDIKKVAYLFLHDTKQTIHLSRDKFLQIGWNKLCQNLN